ncbi:MAG: hypothetical protein Q8R79_07590 [Legionellaceae bacterium]|nr:hypothetical protein [Legionellaceae bacterium]
MPNIVLQSLEDFSKQLTTLDADIKASANKVFPESHTTKLKHNTRDSLIKHMQNSTITLIEILENNPALAVTAKAEIEATITAIKKFTAPNLSTISTTKSIGKVLKARDTAVKNIREQLDKTQGYNAAVSSAPKGTPTTSSSVQLPAALAPTKNPVNLSPKNAAIPSPKNDSDSSDPNHLNVATTSLPGSTADFLKPPSPQNNAAATTPSAGEPLPTTVISDKQTAVAAEPTTMVPPAPETVISGPGNTPTEPKEDKPAAETSTAAQTATIVDPDPKTVVEGAKTADTLASLTIWQKLGNFFSSLLDRIKNAFSKLLTLFKKKTPETNSKEPVSTSTTTMSAGLGSATSAPAPSALPPSVNPLADKTTATTANTDVVDPTKQSAITGVAL